MKTLLLTQDIEGKGGIGNFFKILQKKFTNVDYLINGTRLNESGLLSGIRRFCGDYLAFFKIIQQYDLVHINTSFRIKSVVRDSLFILFSKIYKKKTLVFIHGWNHRLANFTGKYLLWLYRMFFFKADAIIVLSSEFKSTLENWGYTKPIYLISTLVDDDLIIDFSENQIQQRKTKNGKINLLFLSRIEKEKGIYETLEAFRLIQNKFPQAELTVAGDGGEFSASKKFVQQNKIHNVNFLGFVRNDQRINAFKDSDIYVFPTRYGEGMPTAILEAMAFGLPVVTCPVGGINDFFENGKMGALVNNVEPQILADTVINIVKDRARQCEIGLYNHNFIRQNMVASKVLQKIENIYSAI